MPNNTIHLYKIIKPCYFNLTKLKAFVKHPVYLEICVMRWAYRILVLGSRISNSSKPYFHPRAMKGIHSFAFKGEGCLDQRYSWAIPDSVLRSNTPGRALRTDHLWSPAFKTAMQEDCFNPLLSLQPLLCLLNNASSGIL